MGKIIDRVRERSRRVAEKRCAILAFDMRRQAHEQWRKHSLGQLSGLYGAGFDCAEVEAAARRQMEAMNVAPPAPCALIRMEDDPPPRPSLWNLWGRL